MIAPDLFFEALSVTSFLLIAMAAVYIVFFYTRQNREKLRMQRVELSLMRENLERQIYEMNRVLVSNPARWRDVNHLLVNNRFDYSKDDFDRTTNYRSNSFLIKSGVNFDRITSDKRSVFVLMPFHDDFGELYKIIVDGCQELGLKARRGDETLVSGNILPSVIEGILSSRIVLCILDGRNPNVYYELGLTHGLDKPAILVSHEDSDEIPFNVKSNRILFYRNDEDFKVKLRDTLLSNVIEA